jgi:hypothetical protein
MNNNELNELKALQIHMKKRIDDLNNVQKRTVRNLELNGVQLSFTEGQS